MRYSVHFLFLVTAAIAAGVASVLAELSAESLLVMDCLSMAFATAAILGVMQTTGKPRSFWIGTAVVMVPLAFFAVQAASHTWPYLVRLPAERYRGWYDNTHLIWPLWCVAPLNGFFAVFLHWLFAPRPLEHCEGQLPPFPFPIEGPRSGSKLPSDSGDLSLLVGSRKCHRP